MNVLIISTNRNTLPMPVMPLGACVAADAAERAGHTVCLVDLMFEKDPLSAVASAVIGTGPDVVGLSVRNIDNNDMLDPVYFLGDVQLLVNTIKNLTGAPIVLGGAAMGVMAEGILRLTDVSCGVTGDGETVFPLLLDRIAQDEPFIDLPGVAVLENGRFRENPCSSSWTADVWRAPDFRRWIAVSAYRSQLATVPVQTKRGCQFRCVYCTYPKIEGSAYRFSDPEKVAGTIGRLSAAGLRDIEFVDSVFNAPYDHAMAVCESLARLDHGTRLQSLELNPLFVDDDLLLAMERAGFAGIGITAESASDPVLRGLRKGFTGNDVHRAAEAVRRRRLPCAWIFLLGGPGETENTVRETLRFAEKSVRSRDVAFFTIGVRIYPGVALESIARSQGVLDRPAGEMLEPVFYVSPDVGAAWIERQVKRSMADHMNFISMGSIGLPFLPVVHRVARRLGVRPPLWRHTRLIRRGLRMAGMDV
jgi:radical SAM superfamily enzyme YgiQ (UPF0313 family)